MTPDYIEIMKKELVKALGCTEPAAVALACAKAGALLNHQVDAIELWVSTNILKNVMHVGIPGTDKKGIHIAAALGALAGKPELGLEVLKGVSEEDGVRARRLAEDGRIAIHVKDGSERLYIEALCTGAAGNARAIIKGSHTNLTYLEGNGKIYFTHTEESKQNAETKAYGMNVEGIFRFVQEADIQELSFLKEIICVQEAIAGEGLKSSYGMGVGRRILADSQGNLADYVCAVPAAAADARMAGCPLPVISNTGSGNQGLTASLPVIAAAGRLEKTEEEMLRALALSELVTIHVKGYIGKLSPLCGCAIAASIGSAAGLTLLMGGEYSQVEFAIQNMIADVSGLICDGAKAGCALKIATATQAAFQCARLAVKNVQVPGQDGIVNIDVEKSICNLGVLGNQGMESADAVILDMMLQNA